MRMSSVMMLTVAIICGTAAALLTKIWLDSQATANTSTTEKRVKMRTIVVAAKPLSFGTPLTSQNLIEVAWPEGAIPKGAFAKKRDVLIPGKKRLVLSPIAANEPISAWKITGPGQRASLSSLIGKGMKAVTIRVNDVLGVAGFILPGDHVDVLLTRSVRNPDTGTGEKSYTDLLLQNVRVLAIDQLADHRREKPTLAKAVTVEVSTRDSQKVALASSIGQLSLALRKADALESDPARRVSINDLSDKGITRANEANADKPGSVQVIGVTRGLNRTEYSVRPDTPDISNIFNPSSGTEETGNPAPHE